MIIDLNQDGVSGGAEPSFEVRGVPVADLERLSAEAPDSQRWQRIFPVFVGRLGGTDPGQKLPMAGTYRVEAGVIRFSPRYPLVSGESYSALLDLDELAAPHQGASRRIAACFDVPRLDGPPTRARRIYPSADVLPENLLRFYVCFSAPMRQGGALRYIRLLDDAGHEVQAVFLDTFEELWDPSMTRLTLLLDPGRVKTGLIAHDSMGRALVAGRGYRLVVDERFRDARGEPLCSPLEKRFTVTSASATHPDVRLWQILPPAAWTRAPVSVRFPGPLDYVLLSLFLLVRRANGAEVRGQIALGPDETVWQLVPEEPWEPGDHTLEVDARLEDVAGNNLHGLFDRPGQAAQASPLGAPSLGKTVSLAFRAQ